MGYVKVRVFPGQRKEEIQEVGENRFEVKMKEKAERNMANNRMKEILSKVYKVSLSDVRLVSGHRSPSKIFSINRNY